MKKHILGIAIFSLIVTISFLLSFKLIPKSDLMSTVETSEDLANVDLNDITFDILSAKYDSKTNQVTQDISFRWNGKGNPPKFIYVNSAIYSSPLSSYRDFNTVKVNLLFGKNNTANALVMSNLHANSAKNYYADVWVSKEAGQGNNGQSIGFTKSSPILFVH
jgi:hypothetical protein